MGETILGVLQVSILGPPAVSWSGCALTIPRRQARALFYRLAANLHPIPREQLCFLFWPDTSEGEAKRNFTHLLTHLRRALPASGLLRVSDDCVGLDTDRVWSDTSVFNGVWNGQDVNHTKVQNGSPVTNREPRGDLEAIERVMQLYRGPFLSGFSVPACPEYETWITQERRAYECLYLEKLLGLIDVYRDRKEIAKAIDCARRYLEIDELAEEVHRKLIELYASEGNLSSAQRQFEQCMIVLERELSVSPLPETWSVYKAAREGRTLNLRSPSSTPARKTIPKLDAPLIGRDDALEYLDQVVSGQGKVILISGEPGIGKSRLIKAFTSRYQGKALILTATCHPGTHHLPYQPVAEMLRGALSDPPPVFDEHPIWLAEAARLLPELRSLYVNLPSPLPAGPEEARTRLFEALYQLIRCLTDARSPLFLCIDDLHWADSTSLEWLVYLGNRFASGECSHLMVVGTYRSENVDSLNQLRHALGRIGVLAEYPLNGLGTTDVLQLMVHLFGPAFSNQALAARLQRISGGNPFFLLEILQSFMEASWFPIEPAELENLPIPKTVLEAIHRRLERLDPKEQQVLEAAAVLGPSFSFEQVCITAGRSELEILDSLEILSTHHIVMEWDKAYQFHHELFRNAVYKELSYWRRRLLHRRAGDAFEKLHPEDAASLAWHFEQGEAPGKAAGYALQAGINASKVFAHQEAQESFNHAMVLLKHEAEAINKPDAIAANRRMQIQVLAWRGWVFRLLGDMETYLSDLGEASRLAGLLGDGRALANVYIQEAAAHNWYCRYAQAREVAEKALSMSQETCDALMEARAYRELGLVSRATGDFPRAQAALEKALQIFVELNETVLEIHTLGNLSTLFWLTGEYEKALKLASQALTRCDQAELPFDRRLPLGDLGVAAAALGDIEHARAYLQESLSIAGQIADCTQEIFCLGHLGWLAVRQAHPEEAFEYLQDGLALSERINSCAEQSWLHAGIAEAYRTAGELVQAEAHARRGLELAECQDRPYDLELAQGILAGLDL